MKKMILIITFIASYNLVCAQWIEQNSGTLETLNDITFVSDFDGYIVGNNGTLLKTDDGGNNWNSLNTGSSENLISVCFLTNEIGFIGGYSGLVSKTEDGGITWEPINLGLSTYIEIYFINNDIGFIGTADHIYRTVDGGENWNETELTDVGSFIRIYEIEFLTNQIGYALNQTGVLKTIDGGQSWIQTVDDSHPDYNGANFLSSCEIINEDVAYFGSWYYVGLYKTIDSGESFDFDEGRTITALDFPTSEIGYAIDGVFPLNITRTIDSGDNWDTIFTGESPMRLNNIHFINEDKGWVIGNEGLIMYTENGGTLSIDENTELEMNLLIQVYPNPAKSQITVKLNPKIKSKIKSIKIYNSLGQEIYTIKNINTERLVIDLPDVLTNVCLLSVLFDTGEILTKKILIE